MENVEHILIEHMKAIRTELASIKDDTREIKSRITSLEGTTGRVLRETASQYGDIIENQHRYDKLVDRVERIEKRLDLS